MGTRLFRERDEDVLERYRERFRHVLVDEYQDTNLVQYHLARDIAAGSGNLVATGDPDQSIYKWRGARIRNILEFTRDFPGAHVVRLEQNYRSTGPTSWRRRRRSSRTTRAGSWARCGAGWA